MLNYQGQFSVLLSHFQVTISVVLNNIALGYKITTRCIKMNYTNVGLHNILYIKEVQIYRSYLKRCILRTADIIYYHKEIQWISTIRRCIFQTVVNPSPLILHALVLYSCM